MAREMRSSSSVKSSSVKANKRRQGRRKAVLPVRVRGRDASGEFFEELAHTLDLTPTGARLGAIRHQVEALERLTVCYRQRRMEFRVVWTRKLDGVAEYQIGLQPVAQDGEAWGLSPADFQVQGEASASSRTSRASGAA